MGRNERTVGVTPVRHQSGERALLWFGVLGGALAWALRFGWSYFLVPVACVRGTWVLHVVSLAALLIAAAAGLVAWRALRREPDTADGEDAVERRGLLALVGLLLTGFFVVVTVFESISNFVIDPCLKAAGS